MEQSGEPYGAPLFRRKAAGNVKIDVIIPTYKPGEELFELLDRLGKQSLPVNKVILMNTEKSYFRKLMNGRKLVEEYPFVSVFHLKKKEF